MPIGEIDPWRLQYFSTAECPADVFVPTEDSDAWLRYPAQRWVYDKLAVALSQGLEAAPHGVEPPSYPVFSKPIYNLHGMGAGSRIIASAAEYHRTHAPGHLWMTLLDGAHVSSDAALVDGEAHWWRHASGLPAGDGTFDYWAVHAAGHAAIEAYCGAWARQHLRGYSGMVNFETIGGRIIEVHLRFADQWPDLYGQGWVAALVRLYAAHIWDFDDHDRRDGYSVVLFGPHARRYTHPPGGLIQSVQADPRITSVQITFHADRDPSRHAMPPGGFRLAIVNTWDLAAGRAARDVLRQFFLPPS